MNNKVKNEDNNKKINNYNYGNPIMLIFLLALIGILSFLPIWDLSSIYFINLIFAIYVFCFAFTQKKSFCLSKLSKIFIMFFVLRIVFLIHGSNLIADNRFIKLLELITPFIILNNVFFNLCAMFVICSGLFYLIKKYLNNENQTDDKKSILNTLYLLKIEYVIIFFVFIFNIINVYTYEKTITIGSELFLNTVKYSTILSLIAIIPLLLLSFSLLIFTINYYNNDYLDDFESNLDFLLSNNISMFIIMFFLIMLVVIKQGTGITVFILITLFIIFIFKNYINPKLKNNKNGD